MKKNQDLIDDDVVDPNEIYFTDTFVEACDETYTTIWFAGHSRDFWQWPFGSHATQEFHDRLIGGKLYDSSLT